MKRLTAVVLAVIMVLCALLISAVVLANGLVHTITFENDPPGLKPNGWQSADSMVTFFTDSQGADLEVGDYGQQSHGNALLVRHDDPGFLIMDFAVPMKSISLDFGNDDPGGSNPGDQAVLTLFNGAQQVGQEKVVMNRNDIMDQTISYSGASFTRATLFYDVTASAPGLIEVVDDIVLEEAEIEVSLDIKPGSDPNSINLKDQGVLPVAILGSSVDVSAIDLSTITLGGTGVTSRGSAKAPKLAVSFEDVDGDGSMDLVAFFRVQDLVASDALNETTTELMLEAETTGGVPISGTDTVNVVPG